MRAIATGPAMALLDDDACPFDWAEYNLPAELLTQSGMVLGAFAASELASNSPPPVLPPQHDGTAGAI
ncbi:MAG: hypothetical protein IRY96_02250 [Burkholderiales bacterium]|nr:hypothetical protein [Burkholderiales bacterium]